MAKTNHGSSIGEVRVKTKFNPQSNDEIQIIKDHGAEDINRLERHKRNSVNYGENSSEYHRCLCLAQTAMEESVMWAEKALKM